MTETSVPLSPSEQTRRALVDAAITLFGHDGYSGTSTRTIAERAGTNVASIAYHFGGKGALRIACGTAIADRLVHAIGQADLPDARGPEHALGVLEGVLAAFVHFLLLEQDESDIIRFMMRELAEDGPAIPEIYRSAIEPRHRAFCRLWETATGWPAESDRTRIIVFSLIGQVLYFRIGQNIIQTRMSWEGYDEARVQEITDVLVFNLRSAVAAAREESP